MSRPEVLTGLRGISERDRIAGALAGLTFARGGLNKDDYIKFLNSRGVATKGTMTVPDLREMLRKQMESEAPTEAAVPTEALAEAAVPTEALAEAAVPTEALAEAAVPTEAATAVSTPVVTFEPKKKPSALDEPKGGGMTEYQRGVRFGIWLEKHGESSASY
jgi:hypothetical protein